MKKEYDTSDKAWEVYKKMYEENLNFSDIKQDSGRPHIKSQFMHGEKISSEMDFSGEVDFNFSEDSPIMSLGMGKGKRYRTRYIHYKMILEQDSADEYYINMLEECKNRHHSPENISIMPQTGNMQGTKQQIGLDRLDVWLLVLNMKYENNINLLQNHCTMENFMPIQYFLDLFDDVYDYAKTIYHIDRELVDDLIESGKKPLNSSYNIINYMLLAKRFWKQKKRYWDSKNPK